MSRTHWLTLPMGSSEWRVYLADDNDPELTLDGVECEGVAVHETTTILIARSVKPRERWRVLVHEALHGAIASSGLGVTQRWTDQREEVIVRSLTPMLAQAFQAFARLPRVPR